MNWELSYPNVSVPPMVECLFGMVHRIPINMVDASGHAAKQQRCGMERCRKVLGGGGGGRERERALECVHGCTSSSITLALARLNWLTKAPRENGQEDFPPNGVPRPCPPFFFIKKILLPFILLLFFN